MVKDRVNVSEYMFIKHEFFIIQLSLSGLIYVHISYKVNVMSGCGRIRNKHNKRMSGLLEDGL